MVTRIDLGDIAVDVIRKDIKNIHLSVYPPTGKVRITAPKSTDLDTLRVYAISRLAWIKKQQNKLRAQERESQREYLDRESHYVWGKRYLMKITYHEGTPSIELRGNRMVVKLRLGTSRDTTAHILARWYREQIKVAIQDMVEAWSPKLGVKVDKVYVQKMKTKWGGCNPVKRSIRVNTELAKKPAQCLEYIVVHELVHLRVRNHGKIFAELMDTFLPQWKQIRNNLNSRPLSHEDWCF